MKIQHGEADRRHHKADNLAAGLKFFGITESADDTIGTSISFYLLHAVAVASLIWKIETLRNDAIAPPQRTLATVRLLSLFGWPGKDETGSLPKTDGRKLLESQASFTQRHDCKLILALLQQIEREKQSRSSLRQFLYSARSRMDALQKVVERKSPLSGTTISPSRTKLFSWIVSAAATTSGK